MADFHNFSDLSVIHRLEKELLEVRDELRKCNGYDPAMSLVENAKFLMDVARLTTEHAAKWYSQLKKLEKEQENDKNTARGYPIVVGGPVSPDFDPWESPERYCR